MLREIRPAIVLLVLFSALTGLAYPLAITEVAQVALPYQANGSLILKDGKLLDLFLVMHEKEACQDGQDENDEFFHRWRK